MKKLIAVICCIMLMASGPSAEGRDYQDSLEEKTKQAVEQEKNSENQSKTSSDMDSKYSREDIELLARLVYAEARGEPYLGKVAVAASVLNRVESPDYPDTIPGVIYQNNFGFQYCPVSNGQINLSPDDASMRAVRQALNGHDPSNGALSFYNPAKSSNRWIRSRPYYGRIGNHIFVG